MNIGTLALKVWLFPIDLSYCKSRISWVLQHHLSSNSDALCYSRALYTTVKGLWKTNELNSGEYPNVNIFSAVFILFLNERWFR